MGRSGKLKMIQVIKVKDKDEGQIKAHDILKKLVEGTTLLALSGGTTMNYQQMIVQPGDIMPGAICVVDERYGEPFHADSNEKLFLEHKLKDYADKNCIETRKILTGLGFEESGIRYNEIIGELLSRFKRRVGVMGVGANVHTAGIFPNSVSAHSPNLVEAETVNDKFPKRVTITLKALGEFTNFVILMFGQEKKEALRIILDEGENDMQKYPAIFYRKDPVKSFLITDIVL